MSRPAPDTLSHAAWVAGKIEPCRRLQGLTWSFHQEGLAARGLSVSEKPWTNETKVDAVAAVRRCLYSGRLEIPPTRELISELVTLEQRPTPSGRPRIAAPGGSHDDYATALLALVNELEAPSRPGILGVYDAMLKERGTVSEKPPEPPREWAVPKAPELARAQCPVSLRVDNAPVRCQLWHGHPGEHEPGEPIQI